MEIRRSVSGTNESFILVSFPVVVMNYSNKRNLKGCSWLPHWIPFPWGCLGISVLKQVEPFQKPPSLGFYFVTFSFIKSMGMGKGKNALHMFGGVGAQGANLLALALPLRAAVCLLSGWLDQLRPHCCKPSDLPCSRSSPLFLWP